MYSLLNIKSWQDYCRVRWMTAAVSNWVSRPMICNYIHLLFNSFKSIAHFSNYFRIMTKFITSQLRLKWYSNKWYDALLPTYKIVKLNISRCYCSRRGMCIQEPCCWPWITQVRVLNYSHKDSGVCKNITAQHILIKWWK